VTTNRAAVLAALAHHRCSAILRTENARAVRPALDAAIDGGFRVVEVTMTTPDCLQHVEALCKNKELTVGAGTVLTVEQAKQARNAGAKFLVSPVCDPQVIAFCRQHDIVSIPGTYTPTEMLQAHRSGADLVKLFPAPANGPAFVKAVLGPMPFLRIFPTSGVTEDNVAQWFAAGSFGVGFVASLFDPIEIENGNFAAIQKRAQRMIEAVRRAAPAGGSETIPLAAAAR
jgi:Entner-Doudoroff aldolase